MSAITLQLCSSIASLESLSFLWVATTVPCLSPLFVATTTASTISSSRQNELKEARCIFGSRFPFRCSPRGGVSTSCEQFAHQHGMQGHRRPALSVPARHKHRSLQADSFIVLNPEREREIYLVFTQSETGIR